MIGQELNMYEAIAAQVHMAGHEIANHTYSHPDLTTLTLDEARAELQRADDTIRKVTGTHVSNFRPPFLVLTMIFLGLLQNSDTIRLAL